MFISVVLKEEKGVTCVDTCGAERGGRCDMCLFYTEQKSCLMIGC